MPGRHLFRVNLEMSEVAGLFKGCWATGSSLWTSLESCEPWRPHKNVPEQWESSSSLWLYTGCCTALPRIHLPQRSQLCVLLNLELLDFGHAKALRSHLEYRHVGEKMKQENGTWKGKKRRTERKVKGKRIIRKRRQMKNKREKKIRENKEKGKKRKEEGKCKKWKIKGKEKRKLRKHKRKKERKKGKEKRKRRKRWENKNKRKRKIRKTGKKEK